MKRAILFIASVFSVLISQQNTIIGSGLIGAELLNYIVENYKTSTTLGYGPARDVLYGKIDIHDGNLLTGVYSGFTITLDTTADPSSDAYSKGINAEHSWPQSKGAGAEPQKSDMHHLFPTRVEVNSARGSDPFLDIPDANTDYWYRLDQISTSIPADNIDEWSEKEKDGTAAFEVREDHKGNTARAMFYFYAMYQNVADEYFWNQQKASLLNWHYGDPVDSVEYDRSYQIAAYQEDKANPFVLDSSLARRIWWPNENDTASVKVGYTIIIPAGFQLYNAYPNPFNPTTAISYELPVTSHVVLIIYDLLGNKIKTLVNTQESSGIKTVIWDATNQANETVSTGVYLYQIQADEFVQTKKVILVK